MGAKTPNPVAGERFGRMTVCDEPLTRKGRELYFKMLCDCGNTLNTAKGSLISGRAKSCGCLNAEIASKRFTTHGMRSTPIYAVWNMMKQRCSLLTNVQYKDYGGRGIKVCERWLTFENFYKDVGDTPFDRATLERLDNDKDYEPGNIKWATYAEQVLNTRKTVIYHFKDRSMTLQQIASEVGMNPKSLATRVYMYGMPIDLAVTGIAPAAAGYVPQSGGRKDGKKLYQNPKSK